MKLNYAILILTLWSLLSNAQQSGINENFPGSMFSIKGNLSVGSDTNYSRYNAPIGGAIIQGTVGIGTNTPNNSAILDLNSTSKGLLVPRLTSSQISAMVSPANGLLVYNTDSGKLFLNNNGWQPLSLGQNSNSPWSSNAQGINYNSGNVGVNTSAPKAKLNINGGLSVGVGSSGAINETFGAGNSIQMITAFGSECNEHTGTLMYTTMTCQWGAATLNIAISDNWGSYNTTNIALKIGQNLSTFNNNVQANGIVYWGNGLVRTETRDNAGLLGNDGARSGFFETSNPTPSANWYSGASSWQHLIDVRHSNNANNFALQIAGSFFDQDLYYRKTNNDPTTPWKKILTTSSILDYSNLPQGTSVGLCNSGTSNQQNCNSLTVAPITGWQTGCPSGYTWRQTAARYDGSNEKWVYTCMKN